MLSASYEQLETPSTVFDERIESILDAMDKLWYHKLTDVEYDALNQ